MVSKREEIEQIFETCLEQIKSGHESIESVLAKNPEEADELCPRLEAAIWLDEGKSSLDPRPGFVSASRNRLVSQIQKEKVDHTALESAPEMDLWERVRAGLLNPRSYALHLALFVLLLVIVVSGGIKFANTAQEALPGDNTYSMKIVLEDAELESNKDPVEQTRLHTEFVQTRLAEAHDLVMEGRYTYIPETVDRFEYHVDEAIKSLNQLAREDIDQTEFLGATLHEVLVNQTPTLNVLIVAVPQEYKLDIERAVSVSDNGILMVERVLVSVSRPITPTPFNPLSTGNPTSSPAFATSTHTQSALRMTTTPTFLAKWTSTNTPSPLKNREPTQRPASSYSTTQPTSAPTERDEPPTDTPKPPTNTPKPPTATPVPPTDTPVPPTDTPVPPTDTPVPPTSTSVPPTNALQPSTYTPMPPLDTPDPPTSTSMPSTNP
jgi:hypothetical protein